MPAVSKKQRRAMAIALHHPEKLRKKNKGLAKMSQSDLEHFASTKETNLPARKRLRKAVKKHRRM